jgi:hypothetical protein
MEIVPAKNCDPDNRAIDLKNIANAVIIIV